MFRIVQEALSNVAQHAHASRVNVSLVRLGEELRLAIDDDGVGFDPARVAEQGLGLGLHAIRKRIDATGGHDHAFAGDDLGTGTDDDVDAGLNVRVTCLAELRDLALLDRDVAFHYAPPVDHQRIGDHRVGAILGYTLTLTHTVADDFTAAELHFLAVDSEVALDFDHELRIGKPQSIANRRAEHFRISAPRDLHRCLFLIAERFCADGARVLVARFALADLSSGPITAPPKP